VLGADAAFEVAQRVGRAGGFPDLGRRPEAVVLVVGLVVAGVEVFQVGLVVARVFLEELLGLAGGLQAAIGEGGVLWPEVAGRQAESTHLKTPEFFTTVVSEILIHKIV
jgi:hypothetical protein